MDGLRGKYVRKAAQVSSEPAQPYAGKEITTAVATRSAGLADLGLSNPRQTNEPDRLISQAKVLGRSSRGSQVEGGSASRIRSPDAVSLWQIPRAGMALRSARHAPRAP
jgi:hypothetical protein